MSRPTKKQANAELAALEQEYQAIRIVGDLNALSAGVKKLPFSERRWLAAHILNMNRTLSELEIWVRQNGGW